MPDIVVPNIALTNDLYWLLNVSGSGMTGVTLSLFVNDLTPDADTVLADFVKATFGGYADVTLPGPGWGSFEPLDPGAQSTYGTEFEWVSTTAGGTVYGYYVHDAVNSALAWCQRFDVPAPLVVGTVIKVRPKLAMFSRYLPTP